MNKFESIVENNRISFAVKEESPVSEVANGDDGTDQVPPSLQAVISRVEERIRASRLPSATYRVQFNKRCSFRDVQAIVPYLYALGISDLYSSPILQAVPGSPHGYDIVNHAAINADIGTIDDLRSLRSALREHNMGLLTDIVPNHMSAMPELNTWWQDVLENGPSSEYASYFDIDWMPLKPDLANKVLLPILGEQFGQALESGSFSIHFSNGAFWLSYFDRRYPVAPRSYSIILSARLEKLRISLGEHPDFDELLSILTAINNLPARTETEADRLIERRREKEVMKRRLKGLVERSAIVAEYVASCVALLNGVKGEPHSFDLMEALLAEQAYRFSFWRVAADEINYRRFFDINELVAICTENPRVMLATHQLLFALLDEGTISGVRIDHPDGLYDPRGYLVQLQERQFLKLCREACASLGVEFSLLKPALFAHWRSEIQTHRSSLALPMFVVVEKILSRGEELPENWPVHGTVGYEFLNALNGVFVDGRGERALSSQYLRFTNQTLDFDALAYQDKQQIVRLSMASELNVLGHRLDRISEKSRWTRDFTLNSLTNALREVIAAFAVYRSYVERGQILPHDRDHIEAAVTLARRRNPSMDSSEFDFIREVLLLRSHEHHDEDERKAVEQFVGKFQQLTGPVMAKAVEDTTCYRFNRLVSLNEVGGEPKRFGMTPAEFHQFNQSRLPYLSHSLNTTSTHDTKRSEDVRARINVLSEIPREWRQHVQLWSRWNRELKAEVDGIEAPSRNAEYLLYQTLIGTWPGEIPANEDLQIYIGRLQRYMMKVVREAKVHTSWVSPNGPYESAVSQFVAGLFDGSRRHPFLSHFRDFANIVVQHGYWNSLSQVVLKVASPGVADFYQGSELWNLTLVDPDNRYSVDFGHIRGVFDDLVNQMATVCNTDDRSHAIDDWLARPDESRQSQVSDFLKQLVNEPATGKIKLYTTVLALQTRHRFPELFTVADYEPLAVVGRFAEHVLAFRRFYGDSEVVVIAPRLTVGVTGLGGGPPLGDVWCDTSVRIARHSAVREWRNLYTRQVVKPRSDRADGHGLIDVAEALRHFSVALLLPNSSDPSNDPSRYSLRGGD